MTKSLNFKLIFKIIGFLLILEAGFMALSLIPSYLYKGGDFKPILISTLITLFTGIIFWISFRNRVQANLGKKDGYIIVSMAWVIFSLFGALPYFLSQSVDNYTDAFFETMSGVTTTGATIMTSIETLPHGILFWRSITQWIGGMGIIVLSLAVLPMLGIGGLSLFIAEVPGPTKEKIHPRIKETAKRLWGIYLILTLLLTFLLKYVGMNFFDAICHSFTTMATGGFSTKDASIAGFSPLIQYIIVIFMILAGANFTLHYFALHGKFKKIFENEEFKFYIIFISVATLFVFLTLLIFKHFTLEKSFRGALFQVVSIITTTGFITEDYLLWPGSTWFFIFLLFFTGGCAGSTAGGFKMIRQVFILKNSYLELKRLVHPNAVIPVRYNGKPVPQDIIFNVLAFFLFYMLIFAFSSFLLSLYPIIDFETAVGSAASCLGNVGPSLGKTGPASNYYFIPTLGKWFLSFLMLLGRLELFTVLILLSPAFWKK